MCFAESKKCCRVQWLCRDLIVSFQRNISFYNDKWLYVWQWRIKFDQIRFDEPVEHHDISARAVVEVVLNWSSIGDWPLRRDTSVITFRIPRRYERLNERQTSATTLSQSSGPVPFSVSPRAFASRNTRVAFN